MIDAAKFPMLSDTDAPKACKDCGSRLLRFGMLGEWLCTNMKCDSEGETDAQLDDRLQREAEAAQERVYCR